MNLNQLIPDRDALIYLASPYSSPYRLQKEQRYREAVSATLHLTQEGRLVFSPIIHSHPLEEAGLPMIWESWKRVDFNFLQRSDLLMVLTIPGWYKSVGVCDEIDFALDHGKHVYYMHKQPTQEADEHSDARGVEPGVYEFEPADPNWLRKHLL